MASKITPVLSSPAPSRPAANDPCSHGLLPAPPAKRTYHVLSQPDISSATDITLVTKLTTPDFCVILPSVTCGFWASVGRVPVRTFALRAYLRFFCGFLSWHPLVLAPFALKPCKSNLRHVPRLYTNKEYLSRDIPLRFYLTSYIPIDNIPVVDTEGYWLWNSENIAVWNWRQPEPSGNKAGWMEKYLASWNGHLPRVQHGKEAFATCPNAQILASVKPLQTHLRRYVRQSPRRKSGWLCDRDSSRSHVCRKPQTTYPQAWAAYNEAQTNEKDKFQILCCLICATGFR